MSSLGKRFSTRILTVVAGSVLQAIWLVLYARHIGPSDFGAFSIIFSLIMLAGAVFGFGFHNYALRMKHRDERAKRDLSALFLVRACVVAVLSLCTVAVGLAISGSVALVLLVAISAAGVELLSDVTQAILAGRKELKLAAAVLLVQRSLPLVFIVLILTAGLPDFAIFLALCGSSIFTVLPLLRLFQRPSKPLKMIAEAREYWAATVASNVSQIEPLAIGLFSGQITAGFYGAALRVFGPVNLLTNAIITVVVPELASMDSERARIELFRRVRMFTVVFAVTIGLASLPLSWVVVALVGPAYTAAFPFFVGFFIAAGISGVSRAYQSSLFAAGQARKVTVALLIGSVAALAAIPVLTNFGDAFLALTPVVAQSVILALMHILHGMDSSPDRPLRG